MKYIVYVLQSQTDKDLYIGITHNIKRRLKEHNQGKEPSTKLRRPFSLIFCEVFTNKRDAYDREKFLKTGWGRKHLRHALKYTLGNS